MQPQSSASTGFVRLWFSEVSNSTLDAEKATPALLSDSETRRLGRIGSKKRRREYLLSRALMRHALSECFHRPETEWRLSEEPESTPLIDDLPAGSNVSLSHSKGLICFAISDWPLGIDIEAFDRQRDFSALAEVFMNDEELACLARSYPRPAEYFYRVWCAKEAFFKTLSRAEQLQTSLTDIRYLELIRDKPGGYLFEGKMAGFSLAAILAGRPEDIRCSYYLMPEKDLKFAKPLALRE